MPVLHISDAALAGTLVPTPALTVEAEYGSVVIEGTVYTAAHHQPSGPYAGDHVVPGGRPAPCNDTGIPPVAWDVEGGPVALVSHLDLDTVGGLLRAVAGSWPECFLFSEQFDGFWALAAFVDCNGFHKRMRANAAPLDLLRLDAWLAFTKTLPHTPREGVTDVTVQVMACYEALGRILATDAAALDAGRAFRNAEDALNDASFVAMNWGTGVIERKAPSQSDFVNHLYVAPSGNVGRAIVAFNPAHGSITVSLADAIPGVSCRDIVQSLWGPLAGGHAGIAGSPRGQAMTEEDVRAAIEAVEVALAKAAA
jgi:hypothetical protein